MVKRTVKQKKVIDRGPMTFEIKRRRLEKHLQEVEKTIKEWIPQLSAPDPFELSDNVWGWQMVYQPPVEADDDLNHMLRKHLTSRRLWRRHTEWQYALNEIWDQLPSLWDNADRHMLQITRSEMDYTEDFTGTALWQAFHMICRDGVAKLAYHPNEAGSGIQFGAYVIEKSASSDEEFKPVEQEHRQLVAALANIPEMNETVEAWEKIQDLQSNMQSLATTLLRSNDYLNPCRFCRKLWQSKKSDISQE